MYSGRTGRETAADVTGTERKRRGVASQLELSGTSETGDVLERGTSGMTASVAATSAQVMSQQQDGARTGSAFGVAAWAQGAITSHDTHSAQLPAAPATWVKSRKIAATAVTFLEFMKHLYTRMYPNPIQKQQVALTVSTQADDFTVLIDVNPHETGFGTEPRHSEDVAAQGVEESGASRQPDFAYG